MYILLFLLLVTLGYLSGSVCSAVIVSKVFALPDPRTEGSQNPGATNVLRLSGKKYALIVLLADMMKGWLPVVLGNVLGAGFFTTSFICLAAVIGHMFPLFFDFKGGKGVATALGGLLGMHFMLGVWVIATWLLVASIGGYSSLASLVALMMAPLYSILSLGTLEAFFPLMFVTIFIFYKHRLNINRLMDGSEPKIVLKKNNLQELTKGMVKNLDKEERKDEQQKIK